MSLKLNHQMDFEAFPPDVDAPHLDMGAEDLTLSLEQIRAALSQSPLRQTVPRFVLNWTSNPRPIPNTSARRNTESVAEGQRCEDAFRAAVERHGHSIVPTSEGDDFFDRIDFAINTGEGLILVDVKAARRLSRADARPQQKYTWLELHKGGSLFSGLSTHFAFEIEGGFVLVDKVRVRDYVFKMFNSKQRRVECSTQALMRPYRRKGRFLEWISLVKVEDLVMIGGIMFYA